VALYVTQASRTRKLPHLYRAIDTARLTVGERLQLTEPDTEATPCR
jgi:hypothetical protein